jgi:hypothetical protein
MTMTSPVVDNPPGADPRPPVDTPPPCWCGSSADHQTADHEYTPAQGIESEAHDAW